MSVLSRFHYSTGTFASGSTAIAPQAFTFDQMRLDVAGQTIPAGTGLSYEASLPGTTTPVALGVGTVKSLRKDVDTLTMKGTLSASTNKLYTPSLTKLTLTAIGETLLVNTLEIVSNVTASVTGILSTATDRVVGNYSLKVDHASVGSETYTMNRRLMYLDEVAKQTEFIVNPVD